MNLSPFHRHFHKFRLFGIADHRYRFVKRTQAAHVFGRQCKVKLLDSGSPEAQITGHRYRAWLTALHANPARRFFPHQAPESWSRISCWINGEKLRQRFFPQTQPSRTNKENVCAAWRDFTDKASNAVKYPVYCPSELHSALGQSTEKVRKSLSANALILAILPSESEKTTSVILAKKVIFLASGITVGVHRGGGKRAVMVGNTYSFPFVGCAGVVDFFYAVAAMKRILRNKFYILRNHNVFDSGSVRKSMGRYCGNTAWQNQLFNGDAIQIKGKIAKRT